MKFRDYQTDVFSQVVSATTHDLVQLDTGAGKTPVEASIAELGNCIIVAHRNVLISQISEKLAAINVEHDVIATTHTRKHCQHINRRKHGKHCIIQGGHVFVASIDSLLSRVRRHSLHISPSIIIIDEAHHVTADNKWGKLKQIFPNARLIGFTATPARLDGKPLHVNQGGLFERLVQAVTLKKNSVGSLIEQGYLSPFKAFSIPSDINLKALKTGSNGDYTQQSLEESLAKSPVIGDAVKNYKRICNNAQAVVMCISILNAQATSEAFKEAGYPASFVSSKLSANENERRLDAFANRQIKILCNVDMLGEGFDVPGIESVIMLRKTASLVLCRQWIGRALRPLHGKQTAYIIDHVGNPQTHGLPDQHIEWDIERPPFVGRLYSVPCSECGVFFECHLRTCPECGAANKLLRGKAQGAFYVEQHCIPAWLVEYACQKYYAIQAQENHEKRLKTEIVYPQFSNFGGGTIGKACENLLRWFAEQLADQVPFEDLNKFLWREDVCKKTDFIVKFFTVNDLNKPNPAKALRAYRQWQSH